MCRAVIQYRVIQRFCFPTILLQCNGLHSIYTIHLICNTMVIVKNVNKATLYTRKSFKGHCWGHPVCKVPQCWGHPVCKVSQCWGHPVCKVPQCWGHPVCIACRLPSLASPHQPVWGMFQNDEAITLSIILILGHFTTKLFLYQHYIKPQPGMVT